MFFSNISLFSVQPWNTLKPIRNANQGKYLESSLDPDQPSLLACENLFLRHKIEKDWEQSRSWSNRWQVKSSSSLKRNLCSNCYLPFSGFTLSAVGLLLSSPFSLLAGTLQTEKSWMFYYFLTEFCEFRICVCETHPTESDDDKEEEEGSDDRSKDEPPDGDCLKCIHSVQLGIGGSPIWWVNFMRTILWYKMVMDRMLTFMMLDRMTGCV